MIIDLNRISKEGEEFSWNHLDKKLTESLKDLIGDSEYFVKIFLKPYDHHFEMTGEIRTSCKDLCSQCGCDLKYPIEAKVNEILIPSIEIKRNEHSLRSPISFDGPDVREYKDGILNVNDFVHEIIGLSQLNFPKCSENCKGICLNCGINLNFETCRCESFKELENHPFSKLKEIKFN